MGKVIPLIPRTSPDVEYRGFDFDRKKRIYWAATDKAAFAFVEKFRWWGYIKRSGNGYEIEI